MAVQNVADTGRRTVEPPRPRRSPPPPAAAELPRDNQPRRQTANRGQVDTRA